MSRCSEAKYVTAQTNVTLDEAFVDQKNKDFYLNLDKYKQIRLKGSNVGGDLTIASTGQRIFEP